MEYNELKQNIADVVKPNGNQEITGQIMQDALFALIENLGAGYQFGGVVAVLDEPTLDSDVKAFYIARQRGTYLHFGGVSVTEVSVITYDGVYRLYGLGIGFGSEVDARLNAIESDGWVTTNRIANGAVTIDKIAEDSINTPKIRDAAVTIDKIAEDSINTPKIRDAAVTIDKIAEDSINTPKIKDSAITTDKLADKSVTNAKIGDYSITEVKMGNTAINTRAIVNKAVTRDKIADGAISTAQIAEKGIGGSRLNDKTITTDKLADKSVTNAILGDDVLNSIAPLTDAEINDIWNNA